MAKVEHQILVLSHARRAMLEGGKLVGPRTVHWPVAGRCASPVMIERFGRPAGRLNPTCSLVEFDRYTFYGDGFDGATIMTLQMEVPCRKCEPCLRQRAKLWAARARAEISAAPRTWFGTLTLGPDQHRLMQLRATSRLAKGGTDFDALSDPQQFAERHHEIGVELTKWLKRVRKNSDATLRCLLVAEAHKNGLPHYHCLIHETEEGGVVSYRALSEAWPFGFTRFKLTEDNKSAWYVCKYLSKSSLARVRASKGYGTTASSHSVSVNNDPPKAEKF